MHQLPKDQSSLIDQTRKTQNITEKYKRGLTLPLTQHLKVHLQKQCTTVIITDAIISGLLIWVRLGDPNIFDLLQYIQPYVDNVVSIR